MKHHLKGVNVNRSLYLPYERGAGIEFKEWGKLNLLESPESSTPVGAIVSAIDSYRKEIFLKPEYSDKSGIIHPGWYQLCTLKMLNKAPKKPLIGIGRHVSALITVDKVFVPRKFEIMAVDLDVGKIKLRPWYPHSALKEQWWGFDEVRILANSEPPAPLKTFYPNNSRAYTKQEFTPPEARPQRFEDNIVEGVDVRGWFREFTRYTTPMNNEHVAYHDFLMRQGMSLCSNSLNYYRIIPAIDDDGNEVMPTTMFVAHMDTADHGKSLKVNHVFKGDWVMTDKTSVLGADDKAGMTVLFYLMQQQVPGFYLFVWGEERGRKGSIEFNKHWDVADLGFKRCVAFDRKGEDEIITKQAGRIGCSSEFTNALIEAFKAEGMTFRGSPNGSYTDSFTFFDSIPECTNLAVGYVDQHSTSERQNLAFLEDVCYAAGRIDWEGLPTVQDTKERSDYKGTPSNYSARNGKKYQESKSSGSQPALPYEGVASEEVDSDDTFPWHEGFDDDLVGEDNPAGRAWQDLIDARVVNDLTHPEVADFVFDFPEECSDLLYKLLHHYVSASQRLVPPCTYKKNRLN